MPLEVLIDLASRRVSAIENDCREAAQPVDGLLLLRRESPGSMEASLYEPVLCLVLQGSKQVWAGEHRMSFGPGECLLVSHDLPVSSKIARVPYLALVFKIDVGIIRQLCDSTAESVLDSQRARPAVIHRAGPELLDALRRYLALAESPADAKVLGPLVSKEIHYRLLLAPFGGMLRRLLRHDSHESAIARAIANIRSNLRSPIAVPDLARQVGMSASSFHKHFKTITSTTPLQYQKQLRLLEARRLLKMGRSSVTSAAFDVGYESPSQFSREYTRMFRVSPSQDMASVADRSVCSRDQRETRSLAAGRAGSTPLMG